MTKEPKKLLEYLDTMESLDCQLMGSAELKRYAGILNNQLLELWQKAGFCGYDDGLWWFTTPGSLDEILKSFLPNMVDAVVLGRTAFGDLFIHTANNNISVFNTRIEELILTEEDFDFFLNVLLLNEDFKKDILDKNLFDMARNKLGSITHEECYGFIPPLKLGGTFLVENLEKVKLIEHLHILSQL